MGSDFSRMEIILVNDSGFFAVTNLLESKQVEEENDLRMRR